MAYLIASGIIALVFGVLLFFAVDFCVHPCDFCDRILFILDEKINPYRFLVGLVFLALGGWVFYLVRLYPELALLHPLWIILLIFGLLFLLLPHWLTRLSVVANRTVFHTDQFVKGACKSVGLLLILAALYIFYRVYTMQ